MYGNNEVTVHILTGSTALYDQITEILISTPYFPVLFCAPAVLDAVPALHGKMKLRLPNPDCIRLFDLDTYPARRWPPGDAPVITLAEKLSVPNIFPFFRMGACGFIQKSALNAGLIPALEAALPPK